MDNAEVLAHCEKYRRYAVEAKVRADRACTDVDRAVWLLMAESWFSLLPLINSPNITSPNEATETPLVKRLEKLRRTRRRTKQISV